MKVFLLAFSAATAAAPLIAVAADASSPAIPPAAPESESPAAQAGTATVTKVMGDVALSLEGQGRPLHPNDKVPVRGVVKTATDASVAITLSNGTLLHLGAEGELDGTREQLRELGARPPTRSTTQGVAGLTGRELEIVRLVAARRSNKEIGSALGISARTASTHLSNIFAKLGVESRGELADRAREAGLLTLDG